MKNTMKVIGIVLILTALAFAACDTSTSNNSGGTQQSGNWLTIQNIPVPVYNYALAGGQIGIFTVGTTVAQAMVMTGYVAGNNNIKSSEITVIGIGPYTLYIPLYTDVGVRWNGSGTFDVFVSLTGDGGHYYKGSSVNFSSGKGTVDFSIAVELFP